MTFPSHCPCGKCTHTVRLEQSGRSTLTLAPRTSCHTSLFTLACFISPIAQLPLHTMEDAPPSEIPTLEPPEAGAGADDAEEVCHHRNRSIRTSRARF